MLGSTSQLSMATTMTWSGYSQANVDNAADDAVFDVTTIVRLRYFNATLGDPIRRRENTE
jgi:phage tail sheath gpL-like